MITRNHQLLFAFGLLAACLPAAEAQTKEDQWQYGATLYLWTPGISGRTQFPSGAGGPTINVNAKDVLDKLDMAFMGTFEARRGLWGGFVDWVYSDLSDQRTGSRNLPLEALPPGSAVASTIGLSVKTNVLTLAGTYTALDSPANTTAIVFGTRMLKTEQTLNWSLVGAGSVTGLARSGTVTASATDWDAIVGVRGRARPEPGSRWFVPYYLDVGTGASRLTWQATVGLGYAFDFGDVGLVWRYLDYTFNPSDAVQTLTFNGPALGVAFRF